MCERFLDASFDNGHDGIPVLRAACHLAFGVGQLDNAEQDDAEDKTYHQCDHDGMPLLGSPRGGNAAPYLGCSVRFHCFRITTFADCIVVVLALKPSNEREQTQFNCTTLHSAGDVAGGY